MSLDCDYRGIRQIKLSKMINPSAESPKSKVCIIGGGWYGCHIASLLLNKGLDVDLLEKNNKLFGESSSKNQCRLHRGLHYVRSWSTRQECMYGYNKLMKLYPHSVVDVEKNYYLVSQKSPIDFLTVADILTGSQIPYVSVKPEIELTGHQGVLQCDERLFDHNAAADHFEESLGDSIQFNTAVQKVENINGAVSVRTQNGASEYDCVIDCTYNALGLAQNHVKCFYEPCLTLLYKYSLY